MKSAHRRLSLQVASLLLVLAFVPVCSQAEDVHLVTPGEALKQALEKYKSEGPSAEQKKALEDRVRRRLEGIPAAIEQTKRVTAERMKTIEAEQQGTWESLLLAGPTENRAIDPDVLGIRLGMPDDEARIVLMTDQRHRRGAKDELAKREIKSADRLELTGRVSALPNDFSWSRRNDGGVRPGERLEYIVVGADENVAVIQRWQSLDKQELVTEGNLRLALLEKYGEPSFQDPRWDDSMTWVLKGAKKECVSFAGHPATLGLDFQLHPSRFKGNGRRLFNAWNFEDALLMPRDFSYSGTVWARQSLRTKAGCSYLRVLWGNDANLPKGSSSRDVPTDDESLASYIHTELVDYDRLIAAIDAREVERDSAKESVRGGAGMRKPRL